MKVSLVQYAKTLYDLTDGKSERETFGILDKFFNILKRDRQLKNFDKIVENFSKIYNKKKSIVDALVVSREVLDRECVERIEKYIRGKYRAEEVVLRNETDLNIMGGIIIKAEDEILDGSVFGAMEKMKRELLK